MTIQKISYSPSNAYGCCSGAKKSQQNFESNNVNLSPYVSKTHDGKNIDVPAVIKFVNLNSPEAMLNELNLRMEAYKRLQSSQKSS